MRLLLLFVLSATIFIAHYSEYAFAQSVVSINQRDKTYEDSRSRLKVGRPDTNALDALGYVLPNGIIVSPNLSVSGGYDSNPDNLFSEQESSYGVVDGSLVFGYAKPNHATTIALKGKFVEYEGLERSERWDAGIVFDTYYRLSPSLEFSAGALHLHDKVSFTENESTAGYYKFQYSTPYLLGYTEGIAHQIRYLSQQAIDTSLSLAEQRFLYNSEFNASRVEKKAGLMILKDKVVSPYVEGGYAWIDYIDQTIGDEVNRDAQEYWVIAGVRVTFAPQIQADIGYRYNYRDLDDQTFSNYETDYIDARLTWIPTKNFRASLEVDKKLGVPSAGRSRLSKITTYGLLAQYQPTSRILYSLRAYQRRTQEIGDIGNYRERGLQSETTYQVNNKTEFYVNSLWSQLKEQTTQSHYERFKIGLGLRVKYNGTESTPWKSFWDELKELPVEDKVLNTGVSYGYLFLPEIRMMARTDGGLTTTTGHFTNHEGQVDGYQVDLALDQIQLQNPFGDDKANLSLKGFYGRYKGTDITDCNFTASTDCLFVNIQDTVLNVDNNTGPFGTWLARTRRDVAHWGVAIEAPLLYEMSTSSLKDSGKVVVPTSWKFGVAMKAIEQDTNLFAIDTSVPDPVDYDETLDTFYYGVYAAYSRKYHIQPDLALNVTAEGGLYYADTNYEGYYVAYLPIGGGAYILDSGVAYDAHQQEAFIGSLQLELTKKYDWGNFTLNGKAEYYSYAPRIKYNDHDQGGGAILDLVGRQQGTSITNDDAYALSFGGRFSIPLENLVK